MNRDPDARDFAALAEGRDVGLIREMIQFLREHRKWWLVPILLVLLLGGALIVLAGTVASPLIYTVF